MCNIGHDSDESAGEEPGSPQRQVEENIIAGEEPIVSPQRQVEENINAREEPIVSPQRQLEENIKAGGLSLSYEGKFYHFSKDKVPAVLSVLRAMLPPDSLNFGSDPENQQGTDDLSVQNKRKEIISEEAAVGVQPKKGKFVDEGSSSNLAETSCMQCGTSSKSTPMMRTGPNGPMTLCDECGRLWASKSDEDAMEVDDSKNVGGKEGP